MSAKYAIVAVLCLVTLGACTRRATSEVARGKYLVEIMGCGDCHTPGGFSPKPDLSRTLAGSDSEFDVAGIGVFVPPNLTPDNATGIGSWSDEEIVKAVTTGVTPDGRVLSPAMPWAGFSNLSQSDAFAIAAYLKSLPPISNKVPGPAAAKPLPAGTVENILARDRSSTAGHNPAAAS